jgi:ribose 5-phosphate isomerase B
MRIAVGSDHAGFHLKEHVELELAAAGHEVIDVGTGSSRAVDYPRFAADAARLVGEGEVARAILACSSGVGVAIVANKVAGVRAVNAHDPSEAEMSRRHNDVNIVTLSGARLRPSDADATSAPCCARSSRAAATPVASARSPTWSASRRRRRRSGPPRRSRRTRPGLPSLGELFGP